MTETINITTKSIRLKKHFFQIMEKLSFKYTSEYFAELVNNFDNVDIKKLHKMISNEYNSLSQKLLHNKNIINGQFDYDNLYKLYELMTQCNLLYSIFIESIYLDVVIGEHFSRLTSLNYTNDKIKNGGDISYWLTFLPSEKQKIARLSYNEAIENFKYID